MSATSFARELIGPGWLAFRRFFVAFFLIQSLAVTFVATYYTVPSIAAWCDALALIKERLGVFFIVLLNPIAAGIIPEIFRQITGRGDRWNQTYAAEFAYLLLVFSATGVVVELLYRMQSLLFGDQPDVITVAKKVIVDQLLFTPFLAQPLGVGLLFFYRVRFNLTRLIQAWRSGLYRQAVLPLIVPGWLFWFPMTSCIYSLPTNLQIPLFLFGVAAWSLIFVSLARQRTKPSRLIQR